MEDESSSSDSSSDSSEEASPRVQRVRTRFCLPKCDCERPRGRACECEKRGDGMCGDQCQCDPELCRATARSIESSASEKSDDEESE